MTSPGRANGPTEVEVAVAGGGPAGAAVAAFLARAGYEVVILERETFPRFHLGESLLPACVPVLEALGIDLEADGFLVKDGAEFLDEATGECQVYPFADALPGPPRRAFQVERAAFDERLLRAAHEAGATVRHRVEVHEVQADAGGVELQTTSGVVRARYFVDASGVKGFMARRERAIEVIDTFGRAAAFVHYLELAPDAAAELEATGNIKVIRTALGWLWAIPLGGRRLSVGLVSRTTPLDPRSVLEAIASSPELTRLTAHSAPNAPRLQGSYSYVNRRAHGVRYTCIGDAACFLDPVFSSGVTLALVSARRTAERLSVALRGGDEADSTLMSEVATHMSHAYRTFYRLIYRFYHSGMLGNILLAPDPDPALRTGLISILGGDVWRTDNPFADLLAISAKFDPSRYWPES